MGEVDVDEEIDEEGNVDEEEEGDAAVLCRNAQCLGSLLQSWVVESFLEVGVALKILRIYFKKTFCIPRLQRQSQCVIITSIQGAAHMKRLIGHLFHLDNILKSGFYLCILLGWLHVFPRGKSCT